MPDENNARPPSAYQLRTVPAYRLITLRDQDNDAGVGARDAIERAGTTIVASTGYELYISCAQDLLPVLVRVEIREDYPAGENADASSLRLTLECPSGRLVLGSPTGEAIGIDLTTGPGVYRVLVTHHGRLEAERRREQLLTRLAENPGLDLRAAAEEHSGLERYTVALWRTGDLRDEA
ncbi:hypothetical protein [Amycolatopsis samaneae]|uniref:Uncharacterized protein n=1 Tax=Amycolatopsis samaneae TaxID=664691 RepID=A0ABW5GTB7_9PSEU